ncbi:preprotein translocase subunit SecE [Arcanobacterium bovis]|uniref:Protein translocase subunit SecE n=1 Tax=Arcanobacterium bovis TaxID=2529275 RepID=A0A4V2KRB3_9ACTO|nr:preprotein translocase subunit SecE [Arcanobacterium bovis]TBW23604.1 preprotein translocase subunit SecE [Arcanobacterium bovis]
MNDVAKAHGNRVAKESKEGFFARIITFFKQVLAEFKKVQRPTGSELWTMFLTVVGFLIVVMIFVGLLDLGFSQFVFWVFG